MLDFESKAFYNVYDLKEIIRLLRTEDGCPWDREQTHESIRRNFIEETYEVCEAIDEKNAEHLKEELGDVLMQVIFHSAIEEELGSFTLDDVADAS
ncbi:MAG: nucleoside triphosphate pyrophosphohydrolase, partial [Oscillospiraceae bacterium]|nr:nucleoside triphosphate pyrophosphohydrolase [Oscillospiraceae bacterium]